jgi:hypothetical protein
LIALFCFAYVALLSLQCLAKPALLYFALLCFACFALLSLALLCLALLSFA